MRTSCLLHSTCLLLSGTVPQCSPRGVSRRRLLSEWNDASVRGDTTSATAKLVALRKEIASRGMSSNAAALDVYLQLFSKLVAEYAAREVHAWTQAATKVSVLHALICAGLADGAGRACCYSEFVRRRIMTEAFQHHPVERLGAWAEYRMAFALSNPGLGAFSPLPTDGDSEQKAPLRRATMSQCLNVKTDLTAASRGIVSHSNSETPRAEPRQFGAAVAAALQQGFRIDDHPLRFPKLSPGERSMVCNHTSRRDGTMRN